MTYRAVAAIVALWACIAAGEGFAQVREIAGRVVGVADGDSTTLLDGNKTQHKIRLDGIDAPEAGQPFGQRAKQSLSDLAFGRDAEAHCPKTDRYGRRVCKVLVGGVDVGLEQIRRGMAWHFKRYEKEQSPEDRAVYSAAEAQARQARRGLWRDPAPVPPWEWRQKQRERATSSSGGLLSVGRGMLAFQVGATSPRFPALPPAAKLPAARARRVGRITDDSLGRAALRAPLSRDDRQ